LVLISSYYLGTMAAAAAAAPVTMDAYLQVTLRIANANMREKIMAEGYTSLDVLVKKNKDEGIEDQHQEELHRQCRIQRCHPCA
jgi:hypothetical protein